MISSSPEAFESPSSGSGHSGVFLPRVVSLIRGSEGAHSMSLKLSFESFEESSPLILSRGSAGIRLRNEYLLSA